MSPINTQDMIINHGIRKGKAWLILQATYEGSHLEGMALQFVLFVHGKYSLKLPF